MKNIYVYYFTILLPIPFLVWLAKAGRPLWFTILLLIYAIPYRILIDGLRLVDKKLIKRNEIWKLIFPWKRREFIKELYFIK